MLMISHGDNDHAGGAAAVADGISAGATLCRGAVTDALSDAAVWPDSRGNGMACVFAY
jgi:beta-lactamase superfamily II metal-dependent hydrolase